MGNGPKIQETLVISGESIMSKHSDDRFTSDYFNEFYLSQNQIDKLSIHIRFHWTGSYLKSQLTESNTISVRLIGHDLISHTIILPECSRKAFFASQQLKLSFRSARIEYNLPPVVLVRFV